MRRTHLNQGFKEELQDDGHKRMIEKLVALADKAVSILSANFALESSSDSDSDTNDVTTAITDVETIIPTQLTSKDPALIRRQMVVWRKELLAEITALSSIKIQWLIKAKQLIKEDLDRLNLLPGIDVMNTCYCNAVLAFIYSNFWSTGPKADCGYLSALNSEVDLDTNLEVFFQHGRDPAKTLSTVRGEIADALKARLRISVIYKGPTIFYYTRHEGVHNHPTKLIAFEYTGPGIGVSTRLSSGSPITLEAKVTFPIMYRMSMCSINVMTNSLPKLMSFWFVNAWKVLKLAGKEDCLGVLVRPDGSVLYV